MAIRRYLRALPALLGVHFDRATLLPTRTERSHALARVGQSLGPCLGLVLAVSLLMVGCGAATPLQADPTHPEETRLEPQTENPKGSDARSIEFIEQGEDPSSRAPSLERIAIIGASVSAGFGNHNELQVATNPKLGEYLRIVLHEALGEGQIQDYGSSQFFTAPETIGRRQVDKALEWDAQLVVGVDFLFWYANGYPRRNAPRRIEGLQRGLRVLETIEAPLLIGDLPNVEHALQGKSPLRGGGPILRRGQLMTEAQRLEANRILYAWAAERPNVRVFPLASLLEPMVARQPMELRGNHWQTHDLSQALQPDRLHPRVRGMIWVALHIGDELARWMGLPEESFRWAEEEVHAAFWNALEPARKARKEKERRRAQRRAERDRKRADQEPVGER